MTTAGPTPDLPRRLPFCPGSCSQSAAPSPVRTAIGPSCLPSTLESPRGRERLVDGLRATYTFRPARWCGTRAARRPQRRAKAQRQNAAKTERAPVAQNSASSGLLPPAARRHAAVTHGVARAGGPVAGRFRSCGGSAALASIRRLGQEPRSRAYGNADAAAA